MKLCLTCERVYTDDSLKFCRDDGAPLKSVSGDVATALLPRAKKAPTTVPTEVEHAPSIAVLPFVPLSADVDNEYFCDGLSEEIINALSKLENVKVAARTSAFSFKDRNMTVSDIARALAVDTLLEGSVRKAGDRLRITVQLINADDGYQLWSDRYDRQMKDIFDIQDEITLSVVNALKVQLLGDQKEQLLKRYTENTDSYELYLKGRHFFNKQTADDWKRAIEFFQKAIESEPDYAPAHAHIALSLSYCWFFDVLPHEEAVEGWRVAAHRALELDDGLAEAHYALAQLHFYYEWNWEAAEREYRRAIELNPNSPEARQLFGLFLISRERIDEAVTEARRAFELDPLSLAISIQVGWIYWFANEIDEAHRHVKKMLEIEPNFDAAHWQLGSIVCAYGRYEDGIAAYQKSLSLGGNFMALSSLGLCYGLIGKREEAMAVLNQLLAFREESQSEGSNTTGNVDGTSQTKPHVAAINIARVYAGLDDMDQTFTWLDKACEERNGELMFLKCETELGTGELFGKSIRSDPRLTQLFERIGM